MLKKTPQTTQLCKLIQDSDEDHSTQLRGKTFKEKNAFFFSPYWDFNPGLIILDIFHINYSSIASFLSSLSTFFE